MDSEIKDIEGFEGLYAITNDGRVWSYHGSIWLKLRGSGRKYLKVLPDEIRDYKTVCLYKNSKPFYFYVHRLVAKAFLVNPRNKMMVNHKDGNKTNNAISNLEWVTHKENAKHAFANGLTTRGSKNSSTKLTITDVKKIRELYIPRKKVSDLAKMFNISRNYVSIIAKGKSWAWV